MEFCLPSALMAASGDLERLREPVGTGQPEGSHVSDSTSTST